MYHYLWNFFLYAFLGWCMEVSYAALVTGKFVNRGFLNGPLCPIYGFGAIIVLTALDPLKDNLLLLFAGSVVLTSALEWATGFVLEKLFHQRWWDYSDMPFNIGGYICLLFSILWGFACLFVVKLLHPSILFLIHLIPHTVGVVLLVLLSLILLVDSIATIRTIIGINRRLSQIDELAAKIKEASNEFGGNLAEHVLDAAEKGADLKTELEDWKEDLEDFHESLAQRRDARRMDREMELDELRENLGELKDALDQRAAAAVAECHQRRDAKKAELEKAKAALQELLEVRGFGQRRLLKAFPKMRSTQHKTAMEHLCRRLNRS